MFNRKYFYDNGDLPLPKETGMEGLHTTLLQLNSYYFNRDKWPPVTQKETEQVHKELRKRMLQRVIKKNRYTRMLARHPKYKGRQYFWLNKVWQRDIQWIKDQSSQSMIGCINENIAARMNDTLLRRNCTESGIADTTVIDAEMLKEHYKQQSIEREHIFLTEYAEGKYTSHGIPANR